MSNNELDAYILQKILSILPSEQLELIKTHFQEEACYARLLELLDEPENCVPAEQAQNQSDIRTSWRNYRKTHNNRFQTLMDNYTDRYLAREKAAKRSGRKADLENLVSNHSKWNRMMTQRGQGLQYREDLRKLCFVFQLTYPEANELMWSAGQLFDLDNLRDFAIVDCLTKGIYDFGLINDRLIELNVEILFPED